MPAIETFSDFVGLLGVTDYFYIRSAGAPSGSRDKRLALSAIMRSLFAATDNPTARAGIGIVTATAVLDFPSIAANAKSDLTLSVPGAVVGDAVILGLPAAPAAGLVFTGFVSITDTVTIRASNTSSGAVDAASATYRAVVLKST